MPTNKPDDILDALLDFAEDHELEVGEVREELVHEGVDVPAFLARVHNRMEQVRKAERLQWQQEAKRNREIFEAARKIDLSQAGRPELLAQMAQVCARNPNVQANFRNFRELTDEDLRTTLLDLLRLEEHEQK
jgi:hypothetical protein